jgi:hypothetical protein
VDLQLLFMVPLAKQGVTDVVSTMDSAAASSATSDLCCAARKALTQGGRMLLCRRGRRCCGWQCQCHQAAVSPQSGPAALLCAIWIGCAVVDQGLTST